MFVLSLVSLLLTKVLSSHSWSWLPAFEVHLEVQRTKASRLRSPRGGCTEDAADSEGPAISGTPSCPASRTCLGRTGRLRRVERKPLGGPNSTSQLHGNVGDQSVLEAALLRRSSNADWNCEYESGSEDGWKTAGGGLQMVPIIQATWGDLQSRESWPGLSRLLRRWSVATSCTARPGDGHWVAVWAAVSRATDQDQPVRNQQIWKTTILQTETREYELIRLKRDIWQLKSVKNKHGPCSRIICLVDPGGSWWILVDPGDVSKKFCDFFTARICLLHTKHRTSWWWPCRFSLNGEGGGASQDMNR